MTQRFEAEELKSWNLLIRTNDRFQFLTWQISVFYWVGCFFRYCILLPGRLLILLVGLLYMALGMSLIGPMKEGPWKRWLNYHITTSCFQVRSWPSVKGSFQLGPVTTRDLPWPWPSLWCQH